jgi:TolB-like protein/AraC-like DNA-binding protein/Flp pilus assembly protein TadD
MQPPVSMDDQFLVLINRILEENLGNEHFTVEDLAKRAGLSRSMLHRKLIKLTGKSATDYIMEMRLNRAKELLENDVATVSEIAYKVGFNSTSYFHRAFKKRFKVSPGDIKKSIFTNHPQQSELRKTEITKSGKSKYSRFSIVALILLLTIIVSASILYFVLKEKAPSEKSIAILPFDNLSTEAENQFFADGIVEDLLYRLSAISELKVISRTSSEMFRSKGTRTVPEIAELLGVKYILEGSIQRQEDKVRINIQLIDGMEDTHILSKQYDRNLCEIFILQNEIAGKIVEELSLVLTDKQLKSLSKDQTTSLKAFEYGQIGRYHLNKRTKEELLLSVKYFKLAIKEDPLYALAYAELAEAYYAMSWWQFINQQLGRDSAEYLAKRALEIDPAMGEAHSVLGAIYNEYDWKFDIAEKEFQKAIESMPNHPFAYQYYAEYLCEQRKYQKAREIQDKAIQLDPFSFIIRFASAVLYYRMNKYSEAFTENKICQELVKDHPASVGLEFELYLKTGKIPECIESFKKYGILLGEWSAEEADSAYLHGGTDGLLKLRIEKGSWRHEYDKAYYYTLLGEYDKAVKLAELAYKEKDITPYRTSELNALDSFPRFMKILDNMGLVRLK